MAEATQIGLWVLAGVFGAVALGARDPVIRPTALLVATVVLGVFAVARVYTRVVDGRPNKFSVAMQILESVGFVLALALLLLGADGGGA
jgi:uncharacterized membrane protein